MVLTRFFLSLALCAIAAAQPTTPPAILKGSPPGGIGGACNPANLIGYLDSSARISTCGAGNVWTVVGAGAGTVAWGAITGTITNQADLVAYITTRLATVNPFQSVSTSTNAVLPQSPAYANGTSGVGATLTATINGALIVDSFSATAGDRILVKNQASQLQNGVYVVTSAGGGSALYMLTRAANYNAPANINTGGAIPVLNGTANANTEWVNISNVTAVGTDGPSYRQLTKDPTTLAPLASPALTGSPTAPTPSQNDNSTKVSTTAYADLAVANGLAAVNPATAVAAATTTTLPTVTYSNGASGVGATLTQSSAAVLTIDGYTVLLGDRLLVKNQSSAFQNGIYTVTVLGTGVVPFVLTRALDFDMPSNMNNTGAIPVVNGTSNTLTQWLLTSKITTVGTDAVTFSQFSFAPGTTLLPWMPTASPPPALSNWTQLNPGGASVFADVTGGIAITSTGALNQQNAILIAAPGAAFTFTGHITGACNHVNFVNYGITISDGTKYEPFAVVSVSGANQYVVAAWTNSTSSTTDRLSPIGMLGIANDVWLRVIYDGTLLKFSLSPTGTEGTFREVYSESKTAFLSTAPTQLGFVVNSGGTAGGNVACTAIANYYKVTTP